jgi:hypothetical protein
MKKYTQEDIISMLHVVVSDLKHASPERREISDANIKHSLYHHVILLCGDKEHFFHEEKENDGTSRVGLYIKGYIREVWAFLEEAYDLIHDQSYIDNPLYQDIIMRAK